MTFIFFLTEMHWLPSKYLSKWWRNTKWYQRDDGKIHRALEYRTRHDLSFVLGDIQNEPEIDTQTLSLRQARRRRKVEKCHSIKKGDFRVYKRSYDKCMQPKEALVDQLARKVVLEKPIESGMELEYANQWGPVYSSLPLVRVTVMREPFRYDQPAFCVVAAFAVD